MQKLFIVFLLIVLVSSAVEGKRGGEGRKRNRDKKCRYEKSAWTDCDTSSDTRNRTLTLKRGNPSQCEQTKVLSRKCKTDGDVCRYGRGEGMVKGDCDPTTNTKQITLPLKRGEAETCASTKTVSKKCRQRGNRDNQGKRGNRRNRRTRNKNKNKNKECKYRKAPWSECDTTKNIRTRTLTLKNKSPDTCEPTKTITKKCKKACRYSKGAWSTCDPTTNRQGRIDTSIPGARGADGNMCPSTRVIKKQCKEQKCKYQFGEWGECENGERSRTKSLVSGDTDTCQPTKIISKPCTNRQGEERCFFGEWGNFGACQNGVKTKVRPVMTGGENCERKAVKTKPCS